MLSGYSRNFGWWFRKYKDLLNALNICTIMYWIATSLHQKYLKISYGLTIIILYLPFLFNKINDKLTPIIFIVACATIYILNWINMGYVDPAVWTRVSAD